jgi:hypothetical protein
MSGSWPVAAEARAIRLIPSSLQSFVTPLGRPPLRSDDGSRAAERGRSFTLDAPAGHAAAGFSYFGSPPFISCEAERARRGLQATALTRRRDGRSGRACRCDRPECCTVGRDAYEPRQSGSRPPARIASALAIAGRARSSQKARSSCSVPLWLARTLTRPSSTSRCNAMRCGASA